MWHILLLIFCGSFRCFLVRSEYISSTEDPLKSYMKKHSAGVCRHTQNTFNVNLCACTEVILFVNTTRYVYAHTVNCVLFFACQRWTLQCSPPPPFLSDPLPCSVLFVNMEHLNVCPPFPCTKLFCLLSWSALMYAPPHHHHLPCTELFCLLTGNT